MTIDANRYKTYNNVIDTITCVGNAHLQIQKVTSGDIFDIDLDKITKFPLMHVNPTTTEVGKNELTMNFQVFVMDLAEPDESNEQEVLSDTQQIAVDIISIFQHSETLRSSGEVEHGKYARYWTNESFTLEPFTERFDNSLTGWVFTLPIIIETPMQSCDIPFDTSITCLK